VFIVTTGEYGISASSLGPSVIFPWLGGLEVPITVPLVLTTDTTVVVLLGVLVTSRCGAASKEHSLDILWYYQSGG
jgi:hypothetical protein